MRRSGFAGAFEGLKAAKGVVKPGTQIPCGDDNQKSVREFAPVADAESVALQGVPKSKHPDWRQRTIYMRDATHRAALRKWEDEGGKEFSELCEKLCAEYAAR